MLTEFEIAQVSRWATRKRDPQTARWFRGKRVVSEWEQLWTAASLSEITQYPIESTETSSMKDRERLALLQRSSCRSLKTTQQKRRGHLQSQFKRPFWKKRRVQSLARTTFSGTPVLGFRCENLILLLRSHPHGVERLIFWRGDFCWFHFIGHQFLPSYRFLVLY
jgi:hypothetical protein